MSEKDHADSRSDRRSVLRKLGLGAVGVSFPASTAVATPGRGDENGNGENGNGENPRNNGEAATAELNGDGI